jgi:hypothetical protein
MNQPKATLLGFVAASMLPAVYLSVCYPLSGDHDPWSIIGTFFVTYYFVVVAMVALGVPTYLILERFKLVRWWSALGCGAIAGEVSILAITSNLDSSSQIRFAFLGGAAGLLFWFVRRVILRRNNTGCTDA